jgi:putative spermidine/putrescine transport system permease protein
MREAATLPSLQSEAHSLRRRISNTLYQRRTLTLFLILLPPLLWFGVVYVGSLLTLLSQSIFTFDEMAMSVTAELTSDNFTSLLNPANYDIVLRTVLMAVAVTVGCVLIGFPMAYYMAHHAGPREKGFFFVSVMLPMWASYIVKAYAWTVLLAQGGVIYWTCGNWVYCLCWKVFCSYR